MNKDEIKIGDIVDCQCSSTYLLSDCEVVYVPLSVGDVWILRQGKRIYTVLDYEYIVKLIETPDTVTSDTPPDTVTCNCKVDGVDCKAHKDTPPVTENEALIKARDLDEDIADYDGYYVPADHDRIIELYEQAVSHVTQRAEQETKLHTNATARCIVAEQRADKLQKILEEHDRIYDKEHKAWLTVNARADRLETMWNELIKTIDKYGAPLPVIKKIKELRGGTK